MNTLTNILSIVTNEDCMDVMKRYPDNHFDLAIVDPPYGIGFGQFNRTNRFSGGGGTYRANKYHNGQWDDSIPTDEYFNELFRVSKNQIICGGNYFYLPPTRGFVFWYKRNPVKNFSDGEFIWTSFDRPALCFDYPYYGGIEGKTKAAIKNHPTQKPIQLYKWLLQKFAKPGDSILDTHLGSGTNRIAAYELGFNFTGCELNPNYFAISNQTFENYKLQHKLF